MPSKKKKTYSKFIDEGERDTEVPQLLICYRPENQTQFRDFNDNIVSLLVTPRRGVEEWKREQKQAAYE